MKLGGVRCWGVRQSRTGRFGVGWLFAAVSVIGCHASTGPTAAAPADRVSTPKRSAAPPAPQETEDDTNPIAPKEDGHSGPSLADDIVVTKGAWCIRLGDRVDCRGFGTDEVTLSIAGAMREVWFVSGGVCGLGAAGTIECGAWPGRAVSAGTEALQSLPPVVARSGDCVRDESGLAYVISTDAAKPERELGTEGSLHCEYAAHCNVAEGELRCLWPKRGGDVWMQPFTEALRGAVDPDRLARMKVAEVHGAPHALCVRSTDKELFCRSMAEFTDGAVYEIDSLGDATQLAVTEHVICGTVGGELMCVMGGWWKDAIAISGVRDVAELRSTRHWLIARDRSGTVSFTKAGRTTSEPNTVENVDGIAVGEEGACLVRGRDVACFEAPPPASLPWISL